MNMHEFAIYRADLFQIAAHEAVGQKRKFSGLPYYTHPQTVTRILRTYVSRSEGLTDHMICAAYLHDTVEDTKMTFETINEFFGGAVEGIVRGLTNVKIPGLNRAQQKQHDAHKMAAQAWEVKVIKLCDRLHNLPDIIANDPGHAKVYVPETRYLLDTALVGVHDELWNMLDAEIKQYYENNACVAA